jgi:branched-chain amino acid transport system substrate-binding protein
MTMHRGRFVRLAGGGVAAVATGLRAGGAHAATGVTSLRIGVLAPTGGQYPDAARSLVDGVRLRLAQAAPELRATVVVEEVPLGFGGASAASTRLLEGGRVDLVIGGVTAPAARQLAPLFEAHEVPLLLANLGAHVVPPGDQSPYVLHHGLHYWQSSFAFGAWAARRIGRKGFVAAPLADSGYDTIYAFRRGLESAGGSVAGVHVTHAGGRDAGLDELRAAIRAAQPDFVYGLYSGAPAGEFLRAYRADPALRRIPLAGGGLMVEDFALPRLGQGALGVRSALPWANTLASGANAAFAAAYRSRTGRAPDVFALLGYEAALLAATGVARARKQALAPRQLLRALAGASITGPRGTLRVDRDAHTVEGPVYIRETRRVGTRLANVKLALAGPVPRVAELDTPLASGYLNEYLHAG